MKTNGIYIIRNLINNKRYIGSSTNLALRWQNHRCQLNKNNHRNSKLQNSWNKYGAEAFAFEIVETLPEFLSEKQVRGIEQFFLSTSNWDNLYNIATTTFSTCHSPETITKLINTKRSKSKSKGINKYKLKGGTVYRVKIQRDKKRLYVGTFDTYEEALAARMEAEEKYWLRNEPYEKPNKRLITADHFKKSGSGIYQQEDGRYKAQFYIDGKLKHYGNIATYEEALKLRFDLEAKYWGDKPA